MSEISSAEDYLIKEGLVEKPSPTREAILGCLGCIWAQREQLGQSPVATVSEIKSCSGIANSSIAYVLSRLQSTETLSTQVKPAEKTTPSLLYLPGDNRHGQWLRAILGKQQECQYILEETATTTEGAIVPEQTPAGLVDAIHTRRLELGMMQKDLCQVTGVNQTTYSKQETLKNGMGLDDFISYAGALGLRIVLEPVENLIENIPLPPAPDQPGGAQAEQV